MHIENPNQIVVPANNIENNPNLNVNRIGGIAKKITTVAAVALISYAIGVAIGGQTPSFPPHNAEHDSYFEDFPVIPACQKPSFFTSLIAPLPIETGPETPLCQEVIKTSYFLWKEKNGYTKSRANAMAVDCIGKKDTQCKVISEIASINFKNLLEFNAVAASELVRKCIDTDDKSLICEDIAMKAVKNLEDPFLTYYAISPCVGKKSIECHEAVYEAFCKFKRALDAKKPSEPVSPAQGNNLRHGLEATFKIPGYSLPQGIEDLFEPVDRNLESLSLLFRKCMEADDSTFHQIAKEFNPINVSFQVPSLG